MKLVAITEFHLKHNVFWEFLYSFMSQNNIFIDVETWFSTGIIEFFQISDHIRVSTEVLTETKLDPEIIENKPQWYIELEKEIEERAKNAT